MMLQLSSVITAVVTCTVNMALYLTGQCIMMCPPGETVLQGHNDGRDGRDAIYIVSAPPGWYSSL